MFSVFVRQALARRSGLNTLTNLVGRLPTLSSSPTLVVAARSRFFSLSAPLAFPTTKKKTTKKATTTTGRKNPPKTSAATKKKTAITASKSKTKARKPAPKKKVVKKKVVVAKPKKVVAKKVVAKIETPRNTRQFPILCTLFYLWLILRWENSPPSSSSASNARVWYLLPAHVPYSQSQAR